MGSEGSWEGAGGRGLRPGLAAPGLVSRRGHGGGGVGSGGWGGGVTGHRGPEADLWGALGGVCASKGICVDPAWLQGVGQLEGAERDFWKSGVVQCLTLRGA